MSLDNDLRFRAVRFKTGPSAWARSVLVNGALHLHSARAVLFPCHNGSQFDNPRVREICAQLNISKTLSSHRHPQANGKVKAVNKTIKYNLKKKLEEKKGAWAEELPFVIWVYRNNTRNATRKTPFSIFYRD